jgi:c-di-GMP-binding flagellar brake protein YcgR
MNEPDQASSTERRKFERVKLFLSGQLFDPNTEKECSCTVVNLSAGGAALEAAGLFEADRSLVLYIEGFGRFEGTTIRHQGGQLAFQFTIGELKRQRLREMIEAFIFRGLSGVTQLRKHARAGANADSEIVRENGERQPCQVLDISLEGASLKTKMRPSIGETVILGQSRGRVVRHHQDGIAIQYVRDISSAA